MLLQSNETHMGIEYMSKKVQISFSDSQIALIDSLKGEFGETDAEVVRNIVITWFTEKNFTVDIAKQRLLNGSRNLGK